MRGNSPTPAARAPFMSTFRRKTTISCCRLPTMASASTSRPTRVPPGWDSGSSPPWPRSSRPASSAIPAMPAPGSCCGFAASTSPRPGPMARVQASGGGLHPAILRSMTSRDSAASEITPEVLLRAYACGIFPMAESADDPTLFWVEPEMRGVIPLDGFRIASRLARTVRSDAFTVTVNTAFKATIAGCAAPQAGREDTWINKRIRDLYVGLHGIGHAHSVEVWQNDDLVGGLYGVSLGKAFFGESMFHRARDASKVALVHLVARLIAGGFELLDPQYVTEHLRSFGAIEVPRRRYTALLDKALKGEADFYKLPADPPLAGLRALEIIAARN